MCSLPLRLSPCALQVVTEDRAAKRHAVVAGAVLPEVRPASGHHAAASRFQQPPAALCCARFCATAPLIVLQNLQRAASPSWDLLAAGAAAAKHSLAALPPGHPLGEPLRPANQAAQAAAAEGLHPSLAHDQDQRSPRHSPNHGAAAEAEQQQQRAAAELAALQCSVDIDWHSPEQVAQLLRMLHVERLRRQGLQLPLEYQQAAAAQQQQQQYNHPQQHAQ